MRFAINYSPQAEQLWRDGLIQVDVFKCPDWVDLVARVGQTHRAYVHCALFAGRGLNAQADIGLLRHWLATTETLAINTHLAAVATEFAEPSAVTPEDVIRRAVHDVELLGAHFGNDNIMVENIPYPDGLFGDSLLADVVDPAVVSEVVQRTGCGFLLDVAHAIRACEGTNRPDFKAYMDAMPVHALRELHLVGMAPEADERGVRRDHLPMTEGDWQAAEWAIERIRTGKWRKPHTLAFEYGGVGEKFAWRSDAGVIAEQAPRLYALAHSV